MSRALVKVAEVEELDELLLKGSAFARYQLRGTLCLKVLHA